MDLLADSKLTIAVSGSGAFAILGAGYGDPDGLQKKSALLEKLNSARRVTFGVGLITRSVSDRPAVVQRALAAKPDAVWLSFGDPAPFVEMIKASIIRDLPSAGGIVRRIIGQATKPIRAHADADSRSARELENATVSAG